MASIIKVDQLSEKTQGSGITLSHSLKNSSGAEIISPAGTVSNLTKLSLTPSSAPSSPTQGDVYLDSSDNNLKIYTGNFWKNIVFASTISATGGTITDITDNGINYRVHTFTSSGTFEVTSGSGEVEYLVVAGGGGGGNSAGGGGGAGGYRSSVSGESSGGGVSAESKLALTVGSYTVTVGGGGTIATTHGNDGSPSVFASITSVGGGGGASRSGDRNGHSGGSGGGASIDGNYNGGSGTTGQGYAGGSTSGSIGESPAPGGGGAGGVGDTNGGGNAHGGPGLQSNIDGNNYYYAGGGGGGGSGGSNGGIGGGANGVDVGTPTAAPANTGGGGGGNNHSSSGGLGGSGIVIIRYPI